MVFELRREYIFNKIFLKHNFFQKISPNVGTVYKIRHPKLVSFLHDIVYGRPLNVNSNIENYLFFAK